MEKKIIISKQTYQLMYISSKLSSSMNLSYLSRKAQTPSAWPGIDFCKYILFYTVSIRSLLSLI